MTAGLGKSVLKTSESDDRIFGEVSYHSIALLSYSPLYHCFFVTVRGGILG